MRRKLALGQRSVCYVLFMSKSPNRRTRIPLRWDIPFPCWCQGVANEIPKPTTKLNQRHSRILEVGIEPLYPLFAQKA